MSLNQPLLLSSALVHQVLLSPTTYPYKQVTLSSTSANRPMHSSSTDPVRISNEKRSSIAKFKPNKAPFTDTRRLPYFQLPPFTHDEGFLSAGGVLPVCRLALLIRFTAGQFASW